jgi:hypothetical protein|tara:strand:- start:227 stop:991 length:765 start_codon:yes stop_codon:yes gene_type:complete
MKKIYLITSLFFCTLLLNAQIATMEAYVIKDGMTGDYEALEDFVSPLKSMAIKEGNLQAWMVMKRKSGGNLQEIDPQKKVADYLVFNIYKDEAQMEADSWKAYPNYAYSHYKNKMSKKNIDKMMSTNPKESARTYVIENIYQTPNYRPQVGDAINMAPMEALNEDYEQFELGFFMPIWSKIIEQGGLRMWGLARVKSSSDNSYKNLTHFVFQNPTGMEYTFEEPTFIEQKVQEMGMASRKMYDMAEMEIIFLAN